MHVVYERVEKEAEDDPDQHKAGLDQQPPVSDVILQQQNSHRTTRTGDICYFIYEIYLPKNDTFTRVRKLFL